ncbi:MAG: hypothetical protein H7Y17_08830 [Chlorobia bacterium]|nr:hypothetical protein [Fimbriimonadaceae bacterium]
MGITLRDRLSKALSGRARILRWGALARLTVAAIAICPSFASADLDEHNYLPSVLNHLQKAKSALESGQDGLAVAHSRMILHDQGIRVFIDLSETPSSLQESCRKAALKAVETWNETLGAGSLNLVDTAGAAEARIVFSKEVLLRGVQVGGYCAQSRSVSFSTNGSAVGTYSATIYSRYQLPSGQLLSDDCLVNVVTHEIGHMYGLNDCADSSHLMGALNPSKPKTDLQADELEALRQLRLMAFEIQRTIDARSKGN